MDKLNWNHVSELLNRSFTNNIQCTVYLNKSNPVEITDDLDINTKIKKLQKQDAQISQLIENAKRHKLKGYVIENDILFKLRKARNRRIFKQLVVPAVLRLDVLKLCHDNYTGSHLGETKTYIKLNNRFYWPNSFKDTLHHVKSCPVCASRKDPPPNRAPLDPIINFTKPFDKVGMDILELSTTNSGNKYALVFTDYLTKWVEAFPLRDQKAETIAKIFINEIVTRHSAPRELLSDRGTNFMSKLISSVTNYFKINKIQTTPYNPKCDGLTERFNKTLCAMLAVYSDANQTNWDLYLPLVLLAYRTSQQTTTEASPFELLYGREPRLPSDLDFTDNYQPSPFIDSINYGWQEAKRQILKKGLINKAFYDNKYRSPPPEYNEGEYVRLKNHTIKPGLKKKLHNKWSEPVKISKVICPQNIEIEAKGQTKIVNVNNVKKSELIRSQPTVTRSGRISTPRYEDH